MSDIRDMKQDFQPLDRDFHFICVPEYNLDYGAINAKIHNSQQIPIL
jgi:hypothetical protein